MNPLAVTSCLKVTLQHHGHITGLLTDMCAAMFYPSGEKNLSLMLSDRYGPQQREGASQEPVRHGR